MSRVYKTLFLGLFLVVLTGAASPAHETRRRFARIFLVACLAAWGFLLVSVPLLAATGDVISSFTTPDTAPWGIAWDGANLWVTDRNSDSIYEVTTTGAVLSSFAAPAVDPKGLTWDGANLWVTDNVTNLIYKVTTTGTVLDSFPAVGGEPQGLTWDGVNLWVVQANLDTIYEITTAGVVVSSFPLSSTNPEVGHTWDGTNLWQSTGAGVEEWTTTGTLLSSFADPCTSTRGITFDGTNFWIACDGGGANNFIYQLAGPPASLVVDTVSDVVDGDTLSVAALLADPGPDGFTSLREAIIATNNTANGGTPDQIRFDIAGPGPHTIVVSPGGLPAIIDTVIINGATEPDFAGSPVVELDGASAGAAVDGFSLAANSGGSTIRGLLIKRFSGDGVHIEAGADGITIAGNWIGTDGSGSPLMGNADDGVELLGANNTIGGTGAFDRNVINNSGDEGINISGGAATGNTILGNYIGLEPDGVNGSGNGDVGIAVLTGAAGTTIGGVSVAARNVISMNFEGMEINTANNIVQGNYIGTDSSGTLDRGNRSDDGVEIQSGATGNLIGGTAAAAGNLIAFNQRHGVNIVAGTNNAVLGNRIHSNNLRGIDLGNNGVTANDAGDGDGGPNNLQNYPVLATAITDTVGNTVTIGGNLNSTSSTLFRIEFFASSVQDPSGYGEGETYLGYADVTTNGSGDAAISVALPATVAPGDVITATATNPSNDTSEFSAALAAVLNYQPTIAAAIADTSVAENSTPVDNYRDLNDVFADVEDGSALTFSVFSNSNPGLVTVSIDADSAVDLSFAAAQEGIATIVVRATDSWPDFVDETFVVMVTSPTIDDARLFYGEGSVADVRHRHWDETLSQWSSETSTPAANSTIQFTVNEVSPDGSEELLGVLSDTGGGSDLDLLRWNGSAWSVDWSSGAITTANANKRGFDVAYERLSNDALVVYADNSSTPVYRTRSAGVWSGEIALPLNDGAGPNPDTNSGRVRWVELVPRPGSNEIALAYADHTDDLVAIVWDGDQWLTASAATLETNIKQNQATGTTSNRAFDLAYEESTGDLMVAWGSETSSGFWYSSKAATSNSWSAAAQVASAPAAGETHHMDLASEPGGQRIAAGGFDMGDGVERLGLATWTGSAWVDAGEYDSQTWNVNDTGTGDFAGAVGWVGTSGTAVAIYPDDQTGTLDWARWTAGGGWIVQADELVAGKGFTESVHINNFAATNKLLAVFSDSNSDLYAATYDGASWTITNSGSPLETSLSSVTSAPLSLAFEVDEPPGIVSAVADTTVPRDSPPIDNYRDLNDVFRDARDGTALSFAIQSNDNPALVTVVIDADSALDLSFAAGQTGQATIVVRATDSASNFVDETFVVTVNGVTLSSAANQSFTVGDLPTGNSLLTITDDAIAPIITAANDIRVRIDSLFNMSWDGNITLATIGGSAAGKVSTTVAYDSTWKVLIVDVTTDFSPGDQITISGLSYRDFAAPSSADSLELDIYNNGSIAAFDDKTIEIIVAAFPNILSGQADQVFNVGDPITRTRKITIADASTPVITAANDIRIRVPAGVNMVWDTSDLTAKITGQSDTKVSTAVTYEDAGKTLVLDVSTDFVAGDFIHLRELGFANFTARSPADNLEMELLNDGGTSGIDDKTVTVNDGPVLVTAIPDTSVAISSPPVDNYRDLNNVFTDVEDGSALAFTIEDNTDTLLVTVAIDADSALDFSFPPAQAGSATIVVRATDTYGMFVEDTLVIAVTSPPTVVSALPDTTVAEDNPSIIAIRDLNDVFTDVEDGSALSFTIFDNNNPGVVTPTINGADSTLDLGFVADSSGVATIVVRATDSGSATVDDTLIVTVSPVNDDPVVVSALPDTTVSEDNPTIAAIRDLNDVFGDIEDGSALTFTIFDNNNPGVVTATINGADSTLDLGFVTDSSGVATIVVRATDSGASAVDDTLIVTVGSVNDDPFVTSAIPDTTVNENNPTITAFRDLNNVFSDIEDGSALTFMIFDNNNPGVVTPTINGADSTLDLGFVADSSGVATIVVRATDSGASAVDDTLIVTVSPVNDDPVVASALPDTTVSEDNPTIVAIRDLNNVFSDIEDGSALSFTIFDNNNPGVVTPTINGADSTLDIGFVADSSGVAMIVVRATDSGASTVDDTLIVTVSPINDDPVVVSAMPDTTVSEDNPPIVAIRDLNDVFGDIEDGSALSFTIFDNNNPGVVTPTINGADSTLDLAFVADSSGVASIVVRATDGAASSVDDTLIVTVNPVNDDPVVVNGVPDTTVVEDNLPIDNYRDLNSVFDDTEEGSALAFAITGNSNPTLMSVVIDADSALDFTFAPDENGSATIIVEATDAGASAVYDTLVVTASAVNDTPVVAVAIPDTTVLGNSAPIDNYRDLNNVFADLESGGALAFSVDSNSNPALMTAVIDADSALDLSFGLGQAGSATVVVRATDPGLLTTTDTLVVNVTPVSSAVALIDSTGTSYPTQTSAGDPTLALRIGINNPISTGVTLNTSSTIIFSDSTTTYTSNLANPTYVPANARAFTLTFDSAPVGGGFAEGTYDFVLNLAGTDDVLLAYVDTVATTGRNSILVTGPRVYVSSIPLQVETVQPGGRNHEVLALSFQNGYTTDRLLDSLLITSFGVGPGAQNDLDNEVEQLFVYDDVDASLDLSPADTLITQGGFGAGQSMLAVNGWTVPASSSRALIVAANVDSFLARDGDRIDAALLSPLDVYMQGGTVVEPDFAPLNPLDSFGYLTIDGMMAHQLALTPSIIDTLYAGMNDVLLLTLDIPHNGYEADILAALAVADYAPDFSASDFSALRLYRDSGDGNFVAASDSVLGDLVFSGNRHEISGLSETISGTARFFVAADVASNPTTGNHSQPGIPIDGIDMVSANDGPIDVAVVSSRSFVIFDSPVIQVVEQALPVVPTLIGDRDVSMLALSIENNTALAIQLDTLILTNTSTGIGSQADLDNSMAGIHIYEDNGDGAVDIGDALLVGGLSFSGGALSANSVGLSLAPGQLKYLLVAADIDSTCARDGDALSLEVSTSSDLGFDQPLPASGIFPMSTTSPRNIDGMLAFQLSVFQRLDSTIVTSGTDLLMLDIGIPANGYDIDTLNTLFIENQGTATIEHLDTLTLYADGGDGMFDAGLGDDIRVGNFIEDLAIPGGRAFKIDLLSVPLTATCGAWARFYVAADIALDYSVGGSIQFAVPTMGVVVASNHDGPIDMGLIDPLIQLIPKPDRLTVFPYSVGDKRVYAQSTENLNYGVGFYNGYAAPLSLDGIKLFQIGTASSANIDSIHIYSDADTNGLFDPLFDQRIMTLPSSGASFDFIGLNLTVGPKEVTYLFASYDINANMIDSVSIDLQLFDMQSLTVQPSAIEIQGDFPVNSPGVDLTDGMIAAQIATTPAPSVATVADDADVLALSLTIPRNGSLDDVLDFVRIRNVGSAVVGIDIADVRVWKETGGNPTQFDPLADTPLGSLTWTGSEWVNPTALNQSVTASGLPLYVTFTVASNPTNAATVQLQVPINGIQVASGNDGPIDQAIVNFMYQEITTDPLVATLSVDRSNYTVGQPINLSMLLRNEGASGLTGIVPTPIMASGAGAVGFVSGPVPAAVDLLPGEDTTLVWVYTAQTAGDVDLCSFAQTADSLVISQNACAPTFRVQDSAANIPVMLNNMAPATANQGQNDVSLFNFDVDYQTGDSLGETIELHGVQIGIEDQSGAPIPPNQIMDELTIAGSSGGSFVMSIVDSTNPISATFISPIDVPSGDLVSMVVRCDIADNAVFTPFRVRLIALTDIALLSSNDGSAISSTSSNTFPWLSTLVSVNTPADSLLVGSPSGQTILANGGQSDVSMFAIDLLSPGTPNTARELLTDLTLNFADTLGVAIAPSDVVRRVTLMSGPQVLSVENNIPITGSSMTISLATPLVIAPAVQSTVDVLVNLASSPLTAGFRLSVGNPAAVVARDINTSQLVSVATVDPIAQPFPLLSDMVVFQSAASGLAAQHIDRLPQAILPGTVGAPIMDLVLTHQDASPAAALRVDSLSLEFRTPGGAPVFPGDYFSSLTVINGPDTVSVVTSLSSILSLAECRFAVPVQIDPSTTEVLSIYGTTKSTFVTTNIEVVLDSQNLIVYDNNDGSRVTGITGAFPFVSGPVGMLMQASQVVVGFTSRTPANVTATEVGVPAFDLSVQNGVGTGFTDVELRTLRVEVQNPQGALLDPTTLLGGAVLQTSPTSFVAGVVGSSDIVFNVPQGVFSVTAGNTDTVSVLLDLQTGLGNTNFRLAVVNSAAVGIVETGSQGIVAVTTSNASGFPLVTNTSHILGASGENAFTNYPNPFAAGREGTTVTYYLEQKSTVTLKLFTLWGAPVRTLVNRTSLDPGLYQNTIWDGRNGAGDTVNNGVYYLVLEVNGADGSQKTFKRKVGVVR